MLKKSSSKHTEYAIKICFSVQYSAFWKLNIKAEYDWHNLFGLYFEVLETYMYNIVIKFS